MIKFCDSCPDSAAFHLVCYYKFIVGLLFTVYTEYFSKKSDPSHYVFLLFMVFDLQWLRSALDNARHIMTGKGLLKIAWSLLGCSQIVQNENCKKAPLVFH